ncbi:hypothetical protein [Nostoc sp. WHI]|uniref:hypothetical protein n=1 Tax=Nostoc sp. WHI TaxID=2650611 RepID=UPI0018C4EAAE|nr:hypothetical protein [Nostoc sp. WHI]MBG1266455.1 hypothetical protein [Nostoc sp. WHI]
MQEEQYSLGMIVIVEELDSIDLETALYSDIRGVLPTTSIELEIVAASDRFWFGSATCTHGR